jgi:hypothetical protein
VLALLIYQFFDIGEFAKERWIVPLHYEILRSAERSVHGNKVKTMYTQWITTSYGKPNPFVQR